MQNKGFYVIKNDKGQFLQIVNSGSTIALDGSAATVRWTSRRALASEWHRGMPDYVRLTKLDADGRVVFDAAWVVGLHVALRLLEMHGGHLSWRRKREAKLQIAA